MCRLSQECIRELQQEVEDLQKALQDQGAKSEDVSQNKRTISPPFPCTDDLLNCSVNKPCVFWMGFFILDSIFLLFQSNLKRKLDAHM